MIIFSHFFYLSLFINVDINANTNIHLCARARACVLSHSSCVALAVRLPQGIDHLETANLFQPLMHIIRTKLLVLFLVVT